MGASSARGHPVGIAVPVTVQMVHTMVGTPYYMSPEMCRNEAYSFKSDIWALGCVLYELATLSHAFDAQSVHGLILKILRGTYPPLDAQYSAALRALIAMMLHSDPELRPSARRLLTAPGLREERLRLGADGPADATAGGFASSVGAPPSAAAPRRRRRVNAAAAAAAAIATATATATVAVSPPPPPADGRTCEADSLASAGGTVFLEPSGLGANPPVVTAGGARPAAARSSTAAAGRVRRRTHGAVGQMSPEALRQARLPRCRSVSRTRALQHSRAGRGRRCCRVWLNCTVEVSGTEGRCELLALWRGRVLATGCRTRRTVGLHAASPDLKNIIIHQHHNITK